MAILTSDKKIDTFTLSLAQQSRNGRMEEPLMLKSFSYYKIPLLLLSTNTYLVGTNLDDDSFSGEGKIVRKYLKPYKAGVFLVDKAIVAEVGALSQYILGRFMGQLVNGKAALTGEFLFEFAHDIEIASFDTLFNSAFYISKGSVREMKKGVPAWGAVARPSILERDSMFMCFFAYGEQMAIIGPENSIQSMRTRAESLMRPWPEHETFLDKVAPSA
jgi:hypothetical protein